MARRLPVIRSYEQRLVELHAELHDSRSADAGRAEIDRRAPQLFHPGHFYSPVVDLDEIDALADVVFAADPTDLPGIDLHLDAQWDLVRELAESMASAPPTTWRRYRTDNPMYGLDDASLLRAMLRHVAPDRIVEIGSGYSTAAMLDMFDEPGFPAGEARLEIYEPHPQQLQQLMVAGDEERVQIVGIPAQRVQPDVAAGLGPGDLLLIDSTHVLKTGSDVHHELFRLLPALPVGVTIGLHDVFPCFEYPHDWVVEGRNWNEIYGLRAFLQYNEAFRILLWPNTLAVIDPQRWQSLMPPDAGRGGGTIWLRRVR